MNSALVLELRDTDPPDQIEISAQATNNLYSGSSLIYEAPGKLLAIASYLEGFPSQITDSRTLTLGTLTSEYAGGGATVKLSCSDAVGHLLVVVYLRSDPQRQGEQFVSLQFPAEAAGIDTFVSELRLLKLEQKARAIVTGVI